MITIEELGEQLAKYNRQFKKEVFEVVCEEYNFIKGEYIDNLSENIWLAKLIDNLILFETKKGKKYYVASTLLDYDSILQYLKDYNFAGYSMILSDSNYWNYASTTILCDYEMLNEEVQINEK